ncbi:MAG TPA: sodium:proton exchanger [Anaerolineaceae bacterium]|nr:MAG: sodium:proton exchanger [Chloroflexi bacterium GWB2_54_36]HAL16337.1 sodium:proton exchanger [Anaerolineaceae bacterium]HBA91964.1 sodium:proton exchanger [Anaerolineaceae bacterium]
MHELPLLINISIALIVAFLGGTIARKIGLPTIVGYLLAGIIIGPFTPGFKGDVETIRQLAELGVIFLMFGVGLHFSFSDLWRVRDIAIPGALIQTALATLLAFGLSQLWGWSIASGIVLGLSISVASTVVLLRGLMDQSLLNTSHGQAAVGWLVMEDILSVLILVLMPTLAMNGEGFNWQDLVVTLLKAAAFVAIMFFVGVRLFPWLLNKIAHTRSRELFILAILAITLGTAMGASELFGVSLALGAFVAGAIISQSHLSHQVGADIFAFREAFSVLFFVSVGMLVNPTFLWQNIGHVAIITALVVLGKSTIVILMGLFFPRPARTFLVIAVGLAQVGEFSFILGQAGLSLNLLTADQYSLILAASLVSITINPLMYKLLPWLEKTLQHLPGFWKRMDASIPLVELKEEDLQDHVVIVGYGRIGKHLVDVLESLHIPLLVIESDMERIDLLNQRKIPTLYGDAANSEVITHAHLGKARAIISTVPEDSSAATVVTAARDINPDLSIIARAASLEGVQNLNKLGATHIVHPELEGGLELVHHTLLSLGFPLREVHSYADAVRRDNYDIDSITGEEHRSLHNLLTAFEGIEITWATLRPESPIAGKTLAEANIRSRTGASVVAFIRGGQLTANPKSMTVFEADDRIGIIGEQDQIDAARELVEGPPEPMLGPDEIMVTD